MIEFAKSNDRRVKSLSFIGGTHVAPFIVRQAERNLVGLCRMSQLSFPSDSIESGREKPAKNHFASTTRIINLLIDRAVLVAI